MKDLKSLKKNKSPNYIFRCMIILLVSYFIYVVGSAIINTVCGGCLV